MLLLPIVVLIIVAGCDVEARVSITTEARGSVVTRRTEAQLTAAQVVGNEPGTSSVSTSIFNLAKTILGAGMLSLPSGIASFSDKTVSLYPASAILLTMGLVSAYSFSSIGSACKTHNVKTFSAAWAKSTGGTKSAVVISSLITFKTFFACLAYSIVIGDSFSQIARSFGASPAISGRTPVILGLTSLFIFPLCLLKNLDALKYTSILGLVGTQYCVGFMGLRLLDGSYRSGGKFFHEIEPAFRPAFSAKSYKGKEHFVFMLMSMMATAFMAHYNAPKFMAELKEPSMARYNQVTGAAFGYSIATYLLVMWFGFLTFGGSSVGFILNNYASSDSLATFARIAIGGGVLCGYPLTFTAFRDGIFDLTGWDRRLFVPVTVGLLAVITQCALQVKNVGAVLSFSGALIGSLMIFVIPAIMNICNIRREEASSRLLAQQELALARNKHKKVLATKAPSNRSMTIAFNYLMAACGLVVAAVGVAVSSSGGH